MSTRVAVVAVLVGSTALAQPVVGPQKRIMAGTSAHPNGEVALAASGNQVILAWNSIGTLWTVYYSASSDGGVTYKTPTDFSTLFSGCSNVNFGDPAAASSAATGRLWVGSTYGRGFVVGRKDPGTNSLTDLVYPKPCSDTVLVDRPFITVGPWAPNPPFTGAERMFFGYMQQTATIDLWMIASEDNVYPGRYWPSAPGQPGWLPVTEAGQPNTSGMGTARTCSSFRAAPRWGGLCTALWPRSAVRDCRR
jgi:hypothetical protein